MTFIEAKFAEAPLSTHSVWLLMLLSYMAFKIESDWSPKHVFLSAYLAFFGNFFKFEFQV